MSQTLRAIQCALQAHLLNPELALDDVVAETTAVPRAIRLHIYANAYRARMVEALSADYGMLHQYIGDEEFERLILAYIDRHPSQYFSLREVGGHLEQFLQTTAPYRDHLELIELARFEWALCHAFDARDVIPRDIAEFAALDAEQWPILKLQFTPALRCVDLQTNAPALWKALNEQQALPAIAESAAQTWLVWRRRLKLLFRPALPFEMAMLTAFRDGATFSEACMQLAASLPEDEVPQRAVALLQQWLQDELIIV